MRNSSGTYHCSCLALQRSKVSSTAASSFSISFASPRQAASSPSGRRKRGNTVPIARQRADSRGRNAAAAANHQGHLKFQLNPEHLGALTVEIANSAAGTAIRMTADSDQARAIIADAQPRLIAEVRAQGLRVAESHVDLNQHGNGGSAFAQGQQRQSSEDHKPFARTQSVIRDDADDSAARDDGELYA